MRAILVTHKDGYAGNTPFPPIGSVGEILEGPDHDGDYDILFAEWPCFVGEPSWVVHRTMLVFIDDSQNVEKSDFAKIAADSPS